MVITTIYTVAGWVEYEGTDFESTRVFYSESDAIAYGHSLNDVADGYHFSGYTIKKSVMDDDHPYDFDEDTKTQYIRFPLDKRIDT